MLAELDPIERTDRAGFLRWLGKTGLGVVGAAAAVLAERRPAAAAAAACDGYQYQCCCLANPRDHTCRCIPGGLHSWTCCSSSLLYSCIECQDPAYPPTNTCWKGYFICSNAVSTGTRC